MRGVPGARCEPLKPLYGLAAARKGRYVTRWGGPSGEYWARAALLDKPCTTGGNRPPITASGEVRGVYASGWVMRKRFQRRVRISELIHRNVVWMLITLIPHVGDLFRGLMLLQPIFRRGVGWKWVRGGFFEVYESIYFRISIK